MVRSILVPLDGSHFAEHALPLAFSIARQTGATVRLLRVQHSFADLYFWAPTPGNTIETLLLEQFRKETLAYLESVTRSANASSVTVTSFTTVGDATESIWAHAADIGADLVVMTTHGRGMLEQIWLGSVADELVRSLTIPVILVRPSETEARLEKEVAIRHIVVALDGSVFAEKILEPALAIGNAMGADFTLLRVIRPVPPLRHSHRATGFAPPEEVSNGIQRIEEQLRHDAEIYLQKIAERLQAGGAKVQIRVRFAERPAAAILEEMAKSADLVALETHGRHGLARLLLGGVTDKVVRGSSLPVLLCRSTEGKRATHADESSRGPLGNDSGKKLTSAGE